MHFLSTTVCRPSLSTLSLIKWTDNDGKTHKLELFDEICGKWKCIGIRLGLKSDTLDNYEQKSKDNVERCQNVFTHWINNNGHQDYPLTWDGLHILLCDIGKSSVAETLKEGLEKGGITL